MGPLRQVVFVGLAPGSDAAREGPLWVFADSVFSWLGFATPEDLAPSVVRRSRLRWKPLRGNTFGDVRRHSDIAAGDSSSPVLSFLLGLRSVADLRRRPKIPNTNPHARPPPHHSSPTALPNQVRLPNQTAPSPARTDRDQVVAGTQLAQVTSSGVEHSK